MKHKFHDCDFSITSFVLAVVYGVLMALVIRYLSKLITRRERKEAQKVFLVLVILQCLGRTLFFILWPFYGPECSPSVSTPHFEPIIVLGDLPAAIFVSAFSVLVFTFARIYHRVLYEGEPFHRRLFTLIAAFLALCSAGVYIAQIAAWVDIGRHKEKSPFYSRVYPYFLTAICFLTALEFLVYGILLFSHVRRVLREAHARSRLTHTPLSPHRATSLGSQAVASEVAGAAVRGEKARRAREEDAEAEGEAEAEEDEEGRLDRVPGARRTHSEEQEQEHDADEHAHEDGDAGAPLAVSVSPSDEPFPAGARAGHRRSIQQGSADSPDNRDRLAATGPPHNPMRKVAQIAAICAFCLLLRGVFLPIMTEFFHEEGPVVTILYFSFSEIFPLLLMLRVFDTPAPQEVRKVGTRVARHWHTSPADLRQPLVNSGSGAVASTDPEDAEDGDESIAEANLSP